VSEAAEIDASEDLEALAEELFALANERRLRILHEVDEPETRNELADRIDISRQAISKHIDTLLEHGFVRELPGWRETGPVDEFQVNPKQLYAIGKQIADLGELEPKGGPEVTETEPTEIRDEAIDADSIPGETADAHLLLLDGPEAGDRFVLDGEEGRWTIGRDEDRDLCLDHDPYISGQQCELQATEDGHAVVDVYSSNGTFVNFGQLPEGGRTELAPGDVIRLGRTSLVYQRR
jgi:pSer/pThr/pTyr-binding forkhead associated (FHA) protein